MAPIPQSAEIHTSNSNDISVMPETSRIPGNVDIAAPPAIDIEPPKPDATPTNAGRIHKMPAVAFGLHNPLPYPTKIIKKTERFLIQDMYILLKGKSPRV